MTYTAKEFNLPELTGISQKTINEHLKLYQGYVKNLNHIEEMMYGKADDLDPYALKEAIRRKGFEYGGMQNHEYYFGALEGKANDLNPDSDLGQKIIEQFGSYEDWLAGFKKYVVGMRGVGWAMMGYDAAADRLITYWVDEQHLGQLIGVEPILALDMWEHSYCMDYAPSEKMQYVDAFFQNLNWSVLEAWYDLASDKGVIFG